LFLPADFLKLEYREELRAKLRMCRAINVNHDASYSPPSTETSTGELIKMKVSSNNSFQLE
jgi:hypothetical protein